MPYSYEPFLEALPRDWYADDPLLGRILARHRGPDPAADAAHGAWGRACAGGLAGLAEESARPENAPRLEPFDAYGRRVDAVVLPASTRRALAEVEGRAHLGAVHGDPFDFYAACYLYQQNGEAGVGCSMACTDGFVRALEALGDRPDHREAVSRVRGSTPERVWHAAQFVTEPQGGSDVPANETRAEPDAEAYRLFGTKWFCSNINADYFLVTARPPDSPPGGRGIGLFLVPAFLDGEAVRNGCRIERLKDKLGTRELATAEVTFEGARATPVGPLDRGLANLLRYVLTPSRFGCVSVAAATLRRAERIARTYAGRRVAFGRPIADFPLVAETLDTLRREADRAAAALFDLLRLWRVEDADFRVLLSLCKPVLTRRATMLVHDAMMLLGGNGIEERFSPLPRLWRDAVIMETWEGPHNVLLTQALRDLGRYGVDAGAFATRLAGEARPELATSLARLLAEGDAAAAAVPFAALAPRLVDAFADRALTEAKGGA